MCPLDEGVFHILQTRTQNILLAVTLALVLAYGFVIFSKSPVLRVVFLNVGQGDAVFIESPTGAQLLIDAGETIQVLRELSSVMPFYDRSIDVVVATHPDKDHIGAMPDVLSRYKTGVYIDNGAEEESGEYAAIEALLKEKVIRNVTADRPLAISLGGGVSVEILYPHFDTSSLSPNRGSIILLVRYGEHKFLFTGDAPSGIEDRLAQTFGSSIESDVLKLGHHGSKTSSSEYFLDIVKPAHAVISAGENNRYGHPHAEVMERVLDVETHFTWEGRVEFQSDGKELKKK